MDAVFRFTIEEELTMAFRLVLSAVVGGIIGWERRRAARPAGIRTLTLVSVGAATFTLVSIYGFGGFGTVLDPSRVAAQVATGVGFIGAGTMVRAGPIVRGLTTASGIWVAAALGMAAGTGMYVVAVVGALLTFAILHFLPRRRDDDQHGENGTAGDG